MDSPKVYVGLGEPWWLQTCPWFLHMDNVWGKKPIRFISRNMFFSSENWIDILAVVSFSTTTVGSIVVARMTDYLKGHMKITIFCLLAAAGLVFTVLSLVCLGVSNIIIRLLSNRKLFRLLFLHHSWPLRYPYSSCLSWATVSANPVVLYSWSFVSRFVIL